MTSPNPDYRAFATAQFEDAAFVRHLGIELVELGEGWCEMRLPLDPRHNQQNGLVHAGAITTLADHCCGTAASTMCPPGQKVLSLEFKINLLRPGSGQVLRCRAEVIRAGRTTMVTEAKVVNDGGKMVALMIATMAVL
ncbi:MAG: PaaI family thioesterase [Candidatus Hydrogenedentes bacterium]|nr:PaaI family thioesterase [Candidatus Hydrogenedentota bacterium]